MRRAEGDEGRGMNNVVQEGTKDEDGEQSPQDPFPLLPLFPLLLLSLLLLPPRFWTLTTVKRMMRTTMHLLYHQTWWLRGLLVPPHRLHQQLSYKALHSPLG